MGEASGRLGEMAHSTQERVGETRDASVKWLTAPKSVWVKPGAPRRDGSQRPSPDGRSGRSHTVSNRAGKDTYNYLRTEQPLILGVLGFALGAALGAGIPPTRQEDELMGEMRDEYVQRAKEMGEEYLEQGKQMAMAAGEAAKEQAGKEGLTLERDTEKKA